MKKIITLCLLTVIGNSVKAGVQEINSYYSYDFVVDHMCYMVTNNQELTVEFATVEYSKYDANERVWAYEGDIVIPEKVSYLGYEFTVTSLGDNCCEGHPCSQISIPGTVKTIGDRSFASCQNLATVNIANGVESIGEYAFEGCTSLKSIELPESIEKLDDSCFRRTSLAAFVCPPNLKTIGVACFRECSELQRVVFNDNLRSIDDHAFQMCNLKELDLPENLTKIGLFAFGNNPLKTVTIPQGVASIRCFPYCAELEEIILPDSLETVDNFIGCSNLRKVDFRKCRWLTDIVLNGSDVKSVVFPDSLLHWVQDWGRVGPISGTERIEWGGKVKIGSYSFSNLQLDTLVLTEAVSQIEKWAFRASSIKDMYVKCSEPITVDEESAFTEFTYLTCVLHVPQGTKDAYSNANVWRKFSNIVDDLPVPTTTSVKNVKTESRPHTVYDLNGFSVKQLSKGKIYISNGKKIIY